MDFILVQRALSRGRSSFVDDYHCFWIISENPSVLMNGKDTTQKDGNVTSCFGLRKEFKLHSSY